MKRGGGLARRTPLRARTALARTGRLKFESAKEARRKRQYKPLAAAYLAGHTDCELCGRPASEIHHKAGRVGADLLNVDLFAALCRACHAFLTENPAEAYRIGMSVRRIGRGGAA